MATTEPNKLDMKGLEVFTINKNTIDGVHLTSYRMDGNSTRQIDVAINLLFSGHKVEIRDHYERGKNHLTNQYLFDRVLKRLDLEHDLDYLIKSKKIEINKIKFTLRLL